MVMRGTTINALRLLERVRATLLARAQAGAPAIGSVLALLGVLELRAPLGSTKVAMSQEPC
jgi:hypothetical protein